MQIIRLVVGLTWAEVKADLAKPLR